MNYTTKVVRRYERGIMQDDNKTIPFIIDNKMDIPVLVHTKGASNLFEQLAQTKLGQSWESETFELKTWTTVAGLRGYIIDFTLSTEPIIRINAEGSPSVDIKLLEPVDRELLADNATTKSILIFDETHIHGLSCDHPIPYIIE